MGKFLLLTVLFTTGLSAQNSFPKGVDLAWNNVQSEYTNFSEIKPVLVNNGKSPIFLSRLWPNGMAQLQRFNPDTSSWENGEWGITCGTVANPTVPIEIKPQSERKVNLFWAASMDDGDKPTHFIEGKTDQPRPLEGRYRFFLRYTLKPWTLLAGDHGTIFAFVSPEFSVLPN